MEERSLEIANDIEKLAFLSSKNRINAIINHKNPLKLVRAMNAQDVLLTINEVGSSDCLELIEMLNPSQVQEIIDLESWKKDRIDIKRLGTFLCELFEANPDKAIKQIYNLDIELLGLVLKISADIYDTTLNEEPYEFTENYLLSPDRRFVICFKPDKQIKAISIALKQFLESLFERDMKFAIQLLEATRFELASSLEEEAYKWRNKRLMDLGIWPKEDRLKYFSPLNKLREVKIKSDSSFMEHRNFFALNLDEKELRAHPFLKHGIQGCDEKRRASIKNELILALVNMHAEFSYSFGDQKEFKNTLKYVTDLVELGLIEQTRGQISDCTEILENNLIIDILRIGRTLILKLKKYVEDLKKDSSCLLGDNFSLADSPLLEVARALCLKEPLYYEGLSDEKSYKSRYFSSLMEINLSFKAMKELRFRAHVIGAHGFSCTNEIINSFERGALVSHSSIMCRVLINQWNKKENIFSKISQDEIEGIFESGFIKNKLKDDFKKHCRIHTKNLMEKLSELSYTKEELEQRIYDFTTTILIALEQNYLQIL